MSGAWCVAAACGVLAACDPIQSRGLMLSPEPVSQEQMQDDALALTASVAARNGLTRDPHPPFHGEEGWECHSRGLFRVCAVAVGGDVQFLFAEDRSSFSPHGQAVWHQLHQELVAAFGPASVRECRFSRRPDPEAPAGERAVLREICIPRKDGS